MKLFAVIFVVLVQCSVLFGQDGSDINYVKSEELNNSYVGQKLHLDFYKVTRNWLGVQKPSPRIGEKIIVEINNKRVAFIENRKDDGYNYWFSQQYLESVEKVDGFKLRIKEFGLLEIQNDNISVKGFFVFVNKKGKILDEKSFTKELTFPKKDIVEYLVKAKD